MPGLAIIDRPPMHPIRESFLKIRKGRSAYSNFDKLPFVDKDFEIVLAPFSEYFCAHSGLESVAFGRFGFQTFGIKLDFGACFYRIPSKKG